MSKFKILVSQGRCGNCGSPLDRDGTICVKCNNKLRERYKQRKQKKLCSICGNKHKDEGVECSRCKKAKTQERKEHAAKGLCIKCEQPSEKGVYCRRHYEIRKKYILRCYQIGKCRLCSSQRLEHTSCCWNCWLKFRASKCKLTGEELGLLWQAQKGKCAYSGRQLVPGINAHLDHKVSRSRGGSDALDNLQWVDANINYAKRALNEIEFLTLVEEVHHYRIKNNGEKKQETDS